MRQALSDLLLNQTRAWRRLLLALLLLISYLALAPAPPPALDSGWDKANHLLAFAALAFCAHFAWQQPRQRWLLAPLALLGYGLLLELAQGQLPPREASAFDVLADALGLLAGLLLAHAAERFARGRART